MGLKPHLICEQLMVRHRGPTLVDTNVILESWRVGAWRALSSGYRIETVENCVIETQTGYQRRRVEQQVDNGILCKSLGAIHRVDNRELAMVKERAPDIDIDGGEHALWAHALTRSDDWILCGPDRASLRVGVRLGFRERLVSLETLLHGTGYRSKQPLRMNYTAAWLSQALNEMI